MTRTERSALEVLHAMVEMFATGDVSGVGEVVATNYVDHQGLGDGDMRGVDAFVEVVTAARAGYSELRVEVVEFKLTGDCVEGRLHWRGVLHDGGVAVRRETLETVRVDGGLAVEHWGVHL